ncbi:MAG: hypothetical protein M1825_001258 [Sarcosagium campestre]|nr:MAG: hypothetical protein M1825_001258 [Sarcosagium campestre]
MSAPTLINLPPPPSNPETPSDLGPGTPNSGTTSLSALSTTAIKDGHQGHAPPHTHTQGHRHSNSSSSNTNTLEAERADRISRLAGLERVATARGSSGSANLAPGAAAAQPPGYFDNINAQVKERSTVGSASATGSVGGRTTTWASSSDANDADKMSEDQDDGVSSTGGFSDEGNASLVGFGEGASSTISGPVSTGSRIPARQSAALGSPPGGKAGIAALQAQQQGGVVGSASSTASATTATAASAAEQLRDAKMIDGVSDDPNVVDTVLRSPPAAQSGDFDATVANTPERIINERMDQVRPDARAMRTPDRQRDGGPGVGKFFFEDK